MVRLIDVAEPQRSFLLRMPMPEIADTPPAKGPALEERRVAIVTTAGLTTRADTRFWMGSTDYRVIPADAGAGDLIMSHASINYDRSGFQQDLNVVFPIDRLGLPLFLPGRDRCGAARTGGGTTLWAAQEGCR